MTQAYRCECCDPKCPACKRSAGRCERDATVLTVRSDLAGEPEVRFCAECAEDAIESGIFYPLDLDTDDPYAGRGPSEEDEEDEEGPVCDGIAEDGSKVCKIDLGNGMPDLWRDEKGRAYWGGRERRVRTEEALAPGTTLADAWLLYSVLYAEDLSVLGHDGTESRVRAWERVLVMEASTPGPWRVGDAGHTVFGPPNGNPSPETVAGRITNPANARLLAAAPEMRDALQTLLDISESDDWNGSGRLDDALESARMVLENLT